MRSVLAPVSLLVLFVVVLVLELIIIYNNWGKTGRSPVQVTYVIDGGDTTKFTENADTLVIHINHIIKRDTTYVELPLITK